MNTELKLCMGCMNRKEYSGPCEICGYMDNTAYLPQYLAPKTLLAGRYLVGRLLSHNGEGGDYIAYDIEQERPVEIREYMPGTICTREKNRREITVRDGCLPLYKSYLSEFADLYKTLMNSDETDCIRKIYGIFAENNTGYVVMEHLAGVSLSQYLESCGGKLGWDEVKELFPPLFTALNMLHSQSIIHRGLSPESVFVEHGRLKLTAFGTSAIRTADSNINCELFHGYAAYEQYSVSERQGTWTDIYGICAVLYRILTGVVPEDSAERALSDTLRAPHEINPEIPQQVSRTIMSGLALKQTERIHTINELVGRLFEPPKHHIEQESDGPVQPVIARENRPVPERQPERHTPPRRPVQKKKKAKEKTNIGAIIGLSVFLAIVTGFVIAIVYFSNASKQLSEQTTTTTQPPEVTTAEATTSITTVPVIEASEATATTPAENTERILLPNFVNRFYNTLESRYAMLKFNPTYEFNSEYAEGIVFEQDIAPNTEVTGGTEINVKVSKGPESAILPDYVGMKLDEYTSLLSEAGIKYDTSEEETTEVKAGYVVRCSKEVGDTIMLTEDESIIVYYAVKPAETEPPQTEPEENTDDIEEENPEDIEPEV